MNVAKIIVSDMTFFQDDFAELRRTLTGYPGLQIFNRYYYFLDLYCIDCILLDVDCNPIKFDKIEIQFF
jgi:hypothetical protein